ncbi:MAG: RND family transporter [Bradymonadaceae bacterium]
MTPLVETFISRFVRRAVGRYYAYISAASVVLTAIGIWFVATHWNINSDFRALLPRDSEAAQAMEEVGDRIGSGSSLYVVVDSPDMAANKKYAAELADELRQMPEVALAHFHGDREFFERHELLYLKAKDLRTLRKRIDRAIEEEKKEANPLFASLESEDDNQPFVETSDIEAKYGHLAARAPEYLAAEDGYSLTIIVRFSEPSTDLAATHRLLDRIKSTARKLDPESFHEDMSVEYGGGLIRRRNEYRSIVSDIKSSAVFTFFGLLLVIALYFRRLRATALVLAPLIMGVVWTLALAFWVFGELTTVSAFIFAILLGLGIDFSIHLISGYDHARMEGASTLDALEHCYKGVAGATIIAAATTFATFVVLSFARFRGLSQFGQVASIGVVCILGAMLVVLPSLILTFQRLWSHRVRGGETSESVGTIASHDVIGRWAPVVATLTIALTGLAATQYDDLAFEENFRRLGEIDWPWEDTASERLQHRRREARTAARRLGRDIGMTARQVRRAIAPESYEKRRYYETTRAKYRSALRGRRSSTPTLLLFDTQKEARRVSRKLSTLHRRGELDTISSVTSIYSFLPGPPEKQKKRLKQLRKIETLLEEEDLSILEDEARDQIEKLQKKLDVGLVTKHDLPAWTKRLFREAGDRPHAPSEGEDFAYEYVVYVNESIDQMKGRKARKYLRQLLQVRRSTDADFRIGSQSFIYVQMLDEVKRDGPWMIAVALVIVFLILTLSLKSVLRALVSMTPMALGIAWMFGLMVWLGMKLDFFNVIIIPALIGIGVDAGIHFYRRYLERGRGSIATVLRLVGSAVTMASVTSAIGFGGLAITEHGGLQSIGQLAIIGLLTTWLSTMLVMPVVLWFVESWEIEALLPETFDGID